MSDTRNPAFINSGDFNQPPWVDDLFDHLLHTDPPALSNFATFGTGDDLDIHYLGQDGYPLVTNMESNSAATTDTGPGYVLPHPSAINTFSQTDLFPLATAAQSHGTALPLLPACDIAAAQPSSSEPTSDIVKADPDSSDVTTTHRRSKFSAKELEELVRVTVDANPYGAKHGEKTKKWAKVAMTLKKQGHFKASSVETIKNKMKALLAYQEDPDSAQGLQVAREVTSSGLIKMAALLDRASKMQRTATTMTDEQKEKVKVKAEQDRVGGEAIRKNSMATSRRRARTPSPDILTNVDSDSENKAPLDTPVHKKRRVQKEGSNSDVKKLVNLVEQGEVQRVKHQNAVIEQLKEQTRAYVDVSEKYREVISSLSKN